MKKQVRDLFFSRKFVKFLVVGGTGVIVNEGLLAILTEIYAVQLSIAGFIAIESSILSNFHLNNYWTWRDKHHKPFLMRLLQYHYVALIAGSVNYLILIGLSDIGLHHLIANLVGIGFGTVINFLLNNYWTFGKSLRGKEY
jgi:dolichol-phosphate mannosyltransferase